MEIVETWCFQIWVNFGGMAELQHCLRLHLLEPKHISFENPGYLA